MTSHDSFEPKWTAGPWHVEMQAASQGRAWLWGVHHTHAETEDRTSHDVVTWEIENRHDAELIALAPELAAAVLARQAEGGTLRVCRMERDLADRLRMIGAAE